MGPIFPLPNGCSRCGCLGWRLLLAATVGLAFLAAPHASAEGPTELLSFSDRTTKSPVWSVALTSDAKTLALVNGFGTIALRDTATSIERAILKGHTNIVTALALSRDGSTLASASKDETVKLWDVATGKERLTLKGHTGSVLSVAISADGRTVASGSTDDTVRLWDAAVGRLLATLKGHTGAVWSVALTGDGRTLASGSFDGTVKLWDLATHQTRASFTHDDRPIRCVAVTADGRTLAVGNADGLIVLWDVATQKERATFKSGEDAVWSLAFTRDGRTLAAGSTGPVRLWEVATGGVRAVLQHPGNVWSVVFSDDGKTLVSGDDYGKARLWDLTGLRRTGRTEESQLSAEDCAALWVDLGSDGARAYHAVWVLVNGGDTAVAGLRHCLHPVAPVDGRVIPRLIARLDSDRFTERQQADRELEALGDFAEPALHRLVNDPPSMEARRRAEGLLRKLVDSPPRLCSRRAVEVLEYIGTAEARRVLQALSQGAPEAELTREAKASLQRLAGWPGS